MSEVEKEKNHGGRPLKYTPEDFAKKVDEYFAYCDSQNNAAGKIVKPYTITGLCLFLDISRDTFAEYKKRTEFADSTKRALQKVENCVEEGILSNRINTIGGIFNLKNNFGWKDKQEVEVNLNDRSAALKSARERLNKIRNNDSE